MSRISILLCALIPFSLIACLPTQEVSANRSASAHPTFALTVLHQGDNGAFAVGDMDADGKNDIVIARKPKALQWLSYPSLETHPVADGGNVWMEIQAGDVDGDGRMDILAPDMAASEVVWWKNPAPEDDPHQGPWVRHRIGAWGGGFAHDFKIGDINHDLKLDAVLRVQATGAYLVFLQNQPDSWTLIRIDKAFGNGEGTALGDIDGDGDLDISDGLVWLETPSDPVQGAWVQHAFNPNFGSSLTRVAIADMNKDGRNDILVSPSDTSLSLKVAWYEASNPKAGPWSEHVIVPPDRITYIHSLQVGDIDRDGYPDVLTGSDHRGSKEMLIRYNRDKGRGKLWQEQAWPTDYGVWQAVLADVNGDGYPDILSADDANDSQQELWISSGKSGSVFGSATWK